VCGGGRETTSEWGWWDSHGRDSDREMLAAVVQSKPEDKKFPVNFRACAKEYMGERFDSAFMEDVLEKNKANASAIGMHTHDPPQCGDPCPRNESTINGICLPVAPAL
jgi:hypothetical protein